MASTPAATVPMRMATLIRVPQSARVASVTVWVVVVMSEWSATPLVTAAWAVVVSMVNGVVCVVQSAGLCVVGYARTRIGGAGGNTGAGVGGGDVALVLRLRTVV